MSLVIDLREEGGGEGERDLTLSFSFPHLNPDT